MDYAKYLAGQVWFVRGDDEKQHWEPGVIAKSRPWVIISVNKKEGSAVCVPVTSSVNAYDKNRDALYPLKLSSEENYIILNQIKTIGFKNFTNYLYTLNEKYFERLVDNFGKALHLRVLGCKIDIRNTEEPVRVVNRKKNNVVRLKVGTDPSHASQEIVQRIRQDFNKMPMAALSQKYGLSRKELYRLKEEKA